LRIIKNRATYYTRNRCLYCGESIKYGEVCVLLTVIYYHQGNASVKLHLKCIEPFCKALKNLKKKEALEILKYKIERKKDD